MKVLETTVANMLGFSDEHRKNTIDLLQSALDYFKGGESFLDPATFVAQVANISTALGLTAELQAFVIFRTLVEKMGAADPNGKVDMDVVSGGLAQIAMYRSRANAADRPTPIVEAYEKKLLEGLAQLSGLCEQVQEADDLISESKAIAEKQGETHLIERVLDGDIDAMRAVVANAKLRAAKDGIDLPALPPELQALLDSDHKSIAEIDEASPFSAGAIGLTKGLDYFMPPGQRAVPRFAMGEGIPA